ncbi:a-factor receptor [Rhizina undulata]
MEALFLMPVKLNMVLASAYTAACGFSTILAFIPMAWHVKNRNIPAICLIFWLTLFNICALTGSLIWSKDDISNAWDGYGFCDVEIKIFIAAGAGQMGSVAAIARNLARIMSDDISVIRTKARKRREMIQDLLLCFGAPVWMMAVHYIVQPNRYIILTITGCTPTFDRSWPSIVLLLMWPPIISLFSAYYAALVLYRLHKYRARFTDIICNSHSNITKSRFIRLFLLSVALVLIFLPTNLYIFYVNMNVPRLTYSWDLIHAPGWGHILKINTGGEVSFDRWIPVAAGYLLFLFFGMGHDALMMYRGWADAVGVGRFLPDYIMGRKKRSSTYNPGSPVSSSFSIRKNWASKKFFSSSSASSNDTTTTINTDGTVNTLDLEKCAFPIAILTPQTSTRSPNPWDEPESPKFVAKAYSPARNSRPRCSHEGITVQREVDVSFEVLGVRKPSPTGSYR